MRSLSAAELLSLWERAAGHTIVVKALLMLTAAAPERSLQSLVKLSIGRRDALLLALRERLFGEQMISLASCPNCSQQLELIFGTSEIRAGDDFDQPELIAAADGYEATFRLPNSEDLASICSGSYLSHDRMAATEHLLSRCLTKIAGPQGELEIDESNLFQTLPPALIEAVNRRMDEADPQANVQLTMNCVECGLNWPATFDIASYLWAEIDHWARAILRETHLVAASYGWREADILEMTPQRRYLYLQMITQSR